MKIVLGIDPGLNKTGWSILSQEKDQFRLLECGIIKTDPAEEICERLKTLAIGIKAVIVKHSPSDVAIEETFVNKNSLSSLKLGHARGALITSAALHNLRVYEYSATKIKKAVTGNGSADKNQVIHMVKLLTLHQELLTSDEADAAAVAICHFNYQNVLYTI